MRFDVFTIVFLVDGPDASRPPAGEPDPLMDAHLAHQATLHAAGQVLAAGPFGSDDLPDVRGILIYRADETTARASSDADPAVRAGRFRYRIAEWHVPADVLTGGSGHLPSSLAEARSRD